MHLEPTGERMIVEHYRSSAEDYIIYLMHIATYRFAERYTSGKGVLDYGCGSGYGSAWIARSAARVTGVDVAADAIAHAKREYQAPNLEYRQIDPRARLPFDDEAFDTVLSFQVFEHVADTARYLDEVRRVLVPGGQLLLVTPDRSTRLFPYQKPWNRWHLTEYDAASLTRKIRECFASVELLRMSGRQDVIGAELRRCRRMRWMALPFTLPVFPDRARIAMLNLVHALRSRRSASTGELDFDFDESAITIGKDAFPSLNLIAVATK